MDKVKIGDVLAATFKQFLQFFYFGQVKLTMENVTAVMNLGEMYNVAGCMAVCSKFLKNNLNDDNVFQSYGLAILYNQQDLKRSCETIIGLNTNAIFQSTGFLACNQKVLAEVLKLNWLSCTEIDLFESCMSWVNGTSKQNELTKELVQAQLCDLFYEIRFGSISLKVFAALVSTYGTIFTDAEYTDIIQIIAGNEIQATKFNKIRVKRFKLDPWSMEECTYVPMEITIVEVSNSEDLKDEVVKYDGEATLKSSGQTIVILPNAIFIKPGFIYEIRLKLNPPKNCAT
ncbi:uncharacterized protein LOC129580026, partial [Sitodiplosis mosellana]|uniref:uncharacterized protein LOC129579898 n=1 Tax=Sitodiplosis mosellana TaxID=263140 RepID=UPI002443A395